MAGANYRLTRRPSVARLFGLLRWSDLFFQNNISLRSLVPAFLLRKRILIVHQTWLQNTRGGIGWNNRLKYALLRFVTNVAISKAVADRISGHSFVIGNPYDDATFRLIPNVARDKKLVFVGRLVSDKGVDLLLQAMKLLQNDGVTPDLTIVGSGPEEGDLRRLATELALDRQVTFAGQKSGAVLAELLNRHRILVVPSRWAEPFGIVALEGIACGCVVVGSEKGGLKESIGCFRNRFATFSFVVRFMNPCARERIPFRCVKPSGCSPERSESPLNTRPAPSASTLFFAPWIEKSRDDCARSTIVMQSTLTKTARSKVFARRVILV